MRPLSALPVALAFALSACAVTIVKDTSSATPAQFTPVATEVAPATTDAPLSDIKAEVIDRVNAERAKAGRSALSAHATLNLAAQRHADDMARRGEMSHYGANGSTPSDRLRAAGLRSCFTAENIAVGQSSPADVVAGWMNSEGHRRNIQHRSPDSVGVGYSPGANAWVLLFSNPC